MAALQPKELLNMLLEGSPLTPERLEQFMREYRDEDQLFDYKDGAITRPQKRKEGRQIIRTWISGFANSDGGVLIVGVNENRIREIAACEPRIGKQTLIEWATHCLQDMVGYFSPPPRFQIIQHDQGPVLTIAVARAPVLVPCVEAGELKYFLRIGASTVEAPAYLIGDLVLGRRQHPILDLYLYQINYGSIELMPGALGERGRTPQDISFSFYIENSSLRTADEVTMGMISWSVVEGEMEKLNSHLRLFLDVTDLPFKSVQPMEVQLVHRSSLVSGSTMTLAPFQTGRVQDLGPFYLPRHIPLKVTCAAYVVPKGGLPTWFQIEFENLHPHITARFEPKLIQKGQERPKVAWEIAS
jgi:Putative DNA-binding domain